MPNFVKHRRGFHAHIEVAGQPGKPFFATRPRALREVQKLKSSGDISHLEAKELLTMIQKDRSLYESSDALLDALEKDGNLHEVSLVVAIVREEAEEIPSELSNPHAKA
jgi:hypothetical protein